MITTLAGEVSDDELERYCADFESDVLARRQRFVSLVDTTRMTAAPTARQRRSLADWQIKTQDVGNRYNLGIAMVVSSALIRGAMTAMNWLFPPKVRTEVMSDWAPAVAHLEQVLTSHHMALPPEAPRRQRA